MSDITYFKNSTVTSVQCRLKFDLSFIEVDLYENKPYYLKHVVFCQ